MTVGIVANPKYSMHMTGKGHPERPARESVIRESLNKAGLLNQKTMIRPREATIEELRLCHGKEYIELVQKEIAGGKTELSTGDVVISDMTFEVALLAAGGAIEGVDAIMSGLFKRVFCVVRPPGHHATSNKGMGFCVFNNAAIAARYCQKKYGIDRVLIVDWDVHHGNGTEEIFKEDKTVFYFSTHQKGIYPGTGAKDFVGVGTTMNVPVPKGVKSREKVIQAFTGPLAEAMKSFKPEFVIISCGFDAHEKDLLGEMSLTTEDFATLTRIMMDIGNKYAKGRILSVLEGGYNLDALAEASVAHVRAMDDRP